MSNRTLVFYLLTPYAVIPLQETSAEPNQSPPLKMRHFLFLLPSLPPFCLLELCSLLKTQLQCLLGASSHGAQAALSTPTPLIMVLSSMTLSLWFPSLLLTPPWLRTPHVLLGTFSSHLLVVPPPVSPSIPPSTMPGSFSPSF